MSNTHLQTALGLILALVFSVFLFVSPPPATAAGSPTPGETCVGGEVVGRGGDYTDGVNFTFGMHDFENWCAAEAPAGSCCSFMVDENAGGGGTIPVGVRVRMVARAGAGVTVEPIQCGRETPGPNQHNYSCFVVYAPAAPAGVTATLIANPASIVSGESSLLTWGSTGAKFCTGTNFDTQNAISGSLLVSPTDTTKYSVLCTSGTQDATAHQVITVMEDDGSGHGGGGGGGGGGGQCADGLDNDRDGTVDAADSGCTTNGTYNPADDSEAPPQCADGIDNNGDGNIDWPDDPGCSSDNDNLELLPPAELTFEANPPLIKKNQSCTLTLSALSVRSCTLTGPGVSRSFTATHGSISLSEVVTPTLAETSTYKLSCVGLNGKSTSKEVDCKIAPTFEEI